MTPSTCANTAGASATVRKRRTTLADDVADTRRRTPAFDGRCYLCGQPIDCAGIFCHAHGWAAKGPAMTAHLCRLPVWLADGAKVSQLAYRVVTVPFGDPPRPHRVTADLDGATSIVEVVGFLADRLAVNEADVLRALAELVHVGALQVRP